MCLSSRGKRGLEVAGAAADPVSRETYTDRLLRHLEFNPWEEIASGEESEETVRKRRAAFSDGEPTEVVVAHSSAAAIR
jgi:hypothetical protein